MPPTLGGIPIYNMTDTRDNADTIQEDGVLILACEMVYGATTSDAQGMVDIMTAERRARVLDAIYSELMK